MRLYDYQEQALSEITGSKILAWDLGTGKTVSSLAYWQRQNTGRPLLVIAPAAKIRTEDWQVEAINWFGANSQPNITYISYEKLRLMDNQTRRPRWWQYCGARNGGVVYDVIADECHALKNPQSKQSKAVLEIVKSGGLFIGLSGTPMPNGWIDFAGYSKIFGYTKGITEFKNKYCKIVDYKGFPEIVGYYNEDELQRQLEAVTHRLTSDQRAKLPTKQMFPVNIYMSKGMAKRYYEIKLGRVDTRTGELLDNPTRLVSVLRQLTTDARLDHMLSIVNDTSDNAIVFYNYVSERNAILKTLAKTDKKILRYDGDKHDKLPAADANISNTVLVAHYKSASTGLNLQWANVTIYFSPTYSYQDFEQSIGRTHRNRQTKRCLYYLFNVKSTVDRNVWDCLKDKRDFNANLWSGEQ